MEPPAEPFETPPLRAIGVVRTEQQVHHEAPRQSGLGRGAQAEIDFQKRLRAHPMGAFHELAGFPGIRAMEEKYLPADELTKYDETVGL